MLFYYGVLRHLYFGIFNQGFLRKRRADRHYQGTDRRPAQKPHHRLTEKRKRPCRYTPACEAFAEKA